MSRKLRGAHRARVVAAAAAVAAACSPAATPAEAPGFRTLQNPSPAGSSVAFLAAVGSDSARMSWVQDGDGVQALMTSAYSDGAWGPVTTVVERNDLFVNWADFPSIAASSDGTLLAHWLQRSGPGHYAYDVMISNSTDGGVTWSEGRVLHDDGVKGEHGFVSLVAEADGTFTAVWLDGRLSAGEDPRMTLRAARIGPDGSIDRRQELDDRICDCCQTGAARVGGSLVAAYRDRTGDEVRDIYSVRRDADGWHPPAPVARDGWMIPGCPVNGPAVAGHYGVGAVAWFALVDQTPEVKVAFTDDEGASFSAPVLIERGTAQAATLGRVDLEWIGSERVLVIWMTQVDDRAEIRFRTVDRQGLAGPVGVIASTGASRSSGFPRSTVTDSHLLLAWTETGEGGGVRTAIAPLGRFEP